MRSKLVDYLVGVFGITGRDTKRILVGCACIAGMGQ
jgi:hypothetical protein